MAQDGLRQVFSITGKRIWIAGHGGMVGGALMRRLAAEHCEIITASRTQLDLREQKPVRDFVAKYKPDAIIIAAAKVGGILANAAHPAQFFYDNIMINTNILHAAHENGAARVLVLGSSCIYPRSASVPITEDALLSGVLESTNEAYALAKIAAVKMVEYYRREYGRAYIAAMPCNLYGVGDRYDEVQSHVIPALIMRAHRAKVMGAPSMIVWGSGHPMREFMDADDLADALVFLLRFYDGDSHINIGTGHEIRIKDVARIICEVVGYKGKIEFDSSKPDGVPRKGMDNTRLYALGWRPELCQNDDINMSEMIRQGIEKCYADYLLRVIGDDRAA